MCCPWTHGINRIPSKRRIRCISPSRYAEPPRAPLPRLNHRLFLTPTALVLSLHSPSASAFCLILSRRARASARLSAARFCLCAQRHLLRSRFRSLHIPADLYRNPRAWHSSKALMISMQAMRRLLARDSPEGEREAYGGFRLCRGGSAWWATGFDVRYSVWCSVWDLLRRCVGGRERSIWRHGLILDGREFWGPGEIQSRRVGIGSAVLDPAPRTVSSCSSTTRFSPHRELWISLCPIRASRHKAATMASQQSSQVSSKKQAGPFPQGYVMRAGVVTDLAQSFKTSTTSTRTACNR